MQEYKGEQIIDATMAEKVKDLLPKLEADLKSGKADKAIISFVEIGEEFEVRGLRFRVTKHWNNAQIVAQLIGVKETPCDTQS